MRQSLTRLIVSILSTLWPLATEIWDAWGIQLLVLVSFLCQVILVHLGGRRRYCYDVKIGCLIWASYLFSSNIATIALGKLTVVAIRNPENPEYDVELQALLAPLLLMHLGNPDCISAYSVEDTKMGKRRALKLLVHVVLVIWILVRCFDRSSPISMFLYIPLFIAGIIEPVATIFALSSVYEETASDKEVKDMETSMKGPNGDGDSDSDGDSAPSRDWMAFHRFACLRPHRANWIYHSTFVNNWMSVDEIDPKEAFLVTEIEMGFVYDAIYTQIPLVCTKIGLVSRAISISCLVCALCGFSIIFRSAFLLDSYVTYTYALLTGSIIMEVYQIFTLSYSYSAFIALRKWSQQGQRCKSKCCKKILKFLDGVCKGQKMWSNSMGQLNLVDYGIKGDFPKPRAVRCILGKMDQRDKFKRYWMSTHEPVDLCLKETIIKTMRDLEMKKSEITPGHRGLLTLELKDFQNLNNDIKGKIEETYRLMDLDKCIIIWHIATDTLLSSASSSRSSSNRDDNSMGVSKLLSNYMMYLLMCHPYMLSLTTGDITLKYASSKLKALAHPSPRQRLQKAIDDLLAPTILNESQVTTDDESVTFITRNWNVLGDVKQLVTELTKLDDKWKLISRVWIEMLCHAAPKSPTYHHMRMLKRGGELITLVWLLLLHKTDKIPHPKGLRPNHNSKADV